MMFATTVLARDWRGLITRCGLKGVWRCVTIVNVSTLSFYYAHIAVLLAVWFCFSPDSPSSGRIAKQYDMKQAFMSVDSCPVDVFWLSASELAASIVNIILTLNDTSLKIHGCFGFRGCNGAVQSHLKVQQTFLTGNLLLWRDCGRRTVGKLGSSERAKCLAPSCFVRDHQRRALLSIRRLRLRPSFSAHRCNTQHLLHNIQQGAKHNTWGASITNLTTETGLQASVNTQNAVPRPWRTRSRRACLEASPITWRRNR